MKYLLSKFLLALVLFSTACSPLKKAEKSMESGEFNTAISLYKKALKGNNAKVSFLLAEAYRQSNRIEDAIPYYQNAVKSGYQDELASLYLAQGLKAAGRYDEAGTVIDNYLSQGTTPAVLALAKVEKTNIAALSVLKEKPAYFKIKNLQDINTTAAEYSPVYNNGELYFTSNRNGGKVFKGTGTSFTDIFKVKTQGAVVDLQSLSSLDAIINDPNVNEGSVSFTRDGGLMVYAKGNSGKSTGAENVDLYFARYRNGKWFTPRILPVSQPLTWDSSPYLSPDGNTLYFASNREGGFGGTDLYSAKQNTRGRWVDIRNLGSEINTAGNEAFPHVDENGTLYFSSDGHPGFGKLDIFKAVRASGVITIENMGEPINSTSDDFAIFMYDPVRGFFTSNREGGKGDDDIYTFINDDPDLKLVNYFLSGITYTSTPEGTVVLPTTKVILLDKDNKVIDETYTSADGAYKFRVYTEEKYFLVGEKTDYFTTRTEFSTVGKAVDKSTLTEMITNIDFTKDLILDPIILEKPIVLDNIYYDLAKADIREDAAAELDKLVVILKDNPEIIIELSSHTDSRAEDDYNMELSQRRAQSAVNYLISKKIDVSRLTAKGYGESRLLIKNAQTEEEHQKNRRTEFKVIRYRPKLDVEEGEVEDEDRLFKGSDPNGVGK
jgi:peptidoglycan-associated lipoprotein